MRYGFDPGMAQSMQMPSMGAPYGMPFGEVPQMFQTPPAMFQTPGMTNAGGRMFPGNAFGLPDAANRPPPQSFVNTPYGQMGIDQYAAKRDALIQQLNMHAGQMAPRAADMSRRGAPPPLPNIDAMWGRAGQMVDQGWSNPFAQRPQQQMPQMGGQQMFGGGPPQYGTPQNQRGMMRTADFRDYDFDGVDDRDQDRAGGPAYAIPGNQRPQSPPQQQFGYGQQQAAPRSWGSWGRQRAGGMSQYGAPQQGAPSYGGQPYGKQNPAGMPAYGAQQQAPTNTWQKQVGQKMDMAKKMGVKGTFTSPKGSFSF